MTPHCLRGVGTLGLPYGTRGGVGGGLDKPLDEREGGVGVESQSK